jgi:transcriptional regulator with XRE-family HTH domain
VDHRQETREFLTSRRARLSPEQAGLPPSSGERRVLGLRRAEVARLAGVSVEYYTRMERGNLTGVSDAVLAAVADALQLDESERAHLVDLSEAAGSRRPWVERRRPQPDLPPSIQLILDGMASVPALVRNSAMDVLAANTLGLALYSPAFASPVRPVNLARFCFLDPAATSLYADWDAFADANVALLHTEAGRDPDDRYLTQLVEDLCTSSEAFRVRWTAYEVRLHRRGITRFWHPVVGDLDLTFDTLELAGHPGLTLKAYTASPGSESADRLGLLADWAATATGGVARSEVRQPVHHADYGRHC